MSTASALPPRSRRRAARSSATTWPDDDCDGIIITRRGTSCGYEIHAYGDLSKATDPDMVLQFYIGDRVFVRDKPRQRNGAGWRSSSFD